MVTILPRRVAPRAAACGLPARVPVAHSRLRAMAAQSAQALLAPNRPDGRWATRRICRYRDLIRHTLDHGLFNARSEATNARLRALTSTRENYADHMAARKILGSGARPTSAIASQPGFTFKAFTKRDVPAYAAWPPPTT
jgi:hypothetical protein